MSKQYLTHMTRQGERWDNLAWHYYQDVSKMGLLIEENQHVPIVPSLQAGLKLRIPLLEQEQTTVVGLPPWR